MGTATRVRGVAGLLGLVLGLLGLSPLAGGVWAGPLNPIQFQSLGTLEAVSAGTYTIDTTHALWTNPDGSVYVGVVFDGIAVFTFDGITINGQPGFAITGSLPIALLSQTDASIVGGISVSAPNGDPGVCSSQGSRAGAGVPSEVG